MTLDAEPRAAQRTITASRGVQLAVAAYLMWGALTVYWKQLEGFDAVELVAWRMMCAGIVMAVIVTMRRTWASIWGALVTRTGRRSLCMAAALLATNWGSYVWAVGHDRVLETALGYFLAPLITMLLGIFLFDEAPTRAQKFAFGAAAIAVVILTVSYGRPPWIALVIAATWSLYALVKRRSPLGAIDSLAGETFVSFIPALIVVILLSRGADSIAQTAGTADWLLVVGTGIVTAVPLMLFAGAAQSVPFTLLGPLNLIVPVINVILGWAVYDEAMPAERLVGFTFVWIALVAVMWDRVAIARRANGPAVPT
jgi:chloramphenicol-sensitive protein RarD